MKYESHKTSAQSRRKQELKKKRIRERRMIICFFLITVFLLGFFVGRITDNAKDVFGVIENNILAEKTISTEKQSPIEKQTDMDEYPPAEVLSPVTAPKNYSYEEAIAVLNENAQSDPKYKSILKNPMAFPEGLITGLANNPEMLDFVAGYTEEKMTGGGSISSAEAEEKCPLFLQWDQRWGAEAYGDNILAVSGCGPTALSMVIVGLTHNKEASPAQVASFAMENGYYMFGTGTMWSLMTEGASAYHLSSEKIQIDNFTMQKQLEEGAFLICSMKAGDFTAKGHFIVIYASDTSGYFVNDPFCKYRSSIRFTYDQLSTQIKSMWALKGASS